MSTRFVIKRDSSGRPTEGGLRVPGRDVSDEPDQSAKPIVLKTGLRQTSEGRITKPSNSARIRKCHGNAVLSKGPASNGRGLQGSNFGKSDGRSLHNMSPLNKSLAREATLEAHSKPVSEPSVEPNPTASPALGPNDPSGDRKSMDYHQADDNMQRNADAAIPTIQPTRTPDSVHHGITNGYSHSTNASIQAIHEEVHVAHHSNFGHVESQGTQHGESAPPGEDRIPSTGPGASVRL